MTQTPDLPAAHPAPPAPAATPLPLTGPRQGRRGFASARSIGALMLREMSTAYGRSPGGYLWAILEPVAGLALLTAVFAAAFRTPPLGTSFAIFYATGMLPFLMFMDMQNKVSSALLYSRQLLAYPTVTFADAILARIAINLATMLLVHVAIFAGCLGLLDNRVALDLPTILLAYGLTVLLAVGIGVLNCFLFTRYPVVQRGWSILMRPMFIISCIFFLFDTIPEPYQSWLWWNPLVHVIGIMRSGFYANYDALYVSEIYIALLSLICLMTGLLLLRRYHRDLLTL